MAEKKYKAGDVVTLNSGGPRMSVVVYDAAGMVICTWFDGKTPHDRSYPEATLKVSPPLKIGALR